MQPDSARFDVAIVIATLMGPLFAVQVQVWLERRRVKEGRRQQVFYALMRTRASTLAPEHVHALNAVPVEFYGIKTITEAYKDYITHLNSPQNEAWGLRRVDLFMDLLHKISAELHYKFTVVQLKNEYYAPKWQFDLEAEQTTIRQGIANILAGKAALPMDVKSFPVGGARGVQGYPQGREVDKNQAVNALAIRSSRLGRRESSRVPSLYRAPGLQLPVR